MAGRESNEVFMAYTATHKYARISARKVRHLASLVRGKFADEALDILRFQPHRGARMLEKVIKSALGNAEHHRLLVSMILSWSMHELTAGRCLSGISRERVAWPTK